MRRRHLQVFRPLCPACLEQGHEAPITLEAVLRERREIVLEGFLGCGRCRRHYPIIDGVPILVSEPEHILRQQIGAINARRDLPPPLLDLLGSSCGPGSAFENSRYHLSIYARDHYGDLDPEDRDDPPPGSILRLLEHGLALGRPPGSPGDPAAGDLDPHSSDLDRPDLDGSDLEGPVLDVGCSLGRTSFELARRGRQPVLGVDLSFAMLQRAQEVLQDGQLNYGLRLQGTSYDVRRFDVPLPNRELVDFWLCDAAELPFARGKLSLLNHLNVLDCVTSPYDALRAIRRVLAPGGQALIGTPFDWAPSATPFESWLGGHSQRGGSGGRSEPMLRTLLGGEHPAALHDLRWIAGKTAPSWHLRLDDRHMATYQTYLAWARRAGPG